MDNNTLYEWILTSAFTISARAEGFRRLWEPLSRLVSPGDAVLDLCCGSGSASFWFEDHGATVTALDFAPYMLRLADQEASRRSSRVEFIEADIFTHDFGVERYDLISCFGNSISDFPLSDFARLGPKIARALKPAGRFALDYHDGSYDHFQGTAPREVVVFQEIPQRITYHFKEYLPEIGARVGLIRNETLQEEYERKLYIYTVPVVRLAMSPSLALETHQALTENHFLDIFTR